MGKHRVVRGLPDNLKETSLQVSADLESDDAEAKARLQAIRAAMSRDDFLVLMLAAKGHGPRLLQRQYKRTTDYWALRIREVLTIAWRVLDPSGFEQVNAFFNRAEAADFDECEISP